MLRTLKPRSEGCPRLWIDIPANALNEQSNLLANLFRAMPCAAARLVLVIALIGSLSPDAHADDDASVRSKTEDAFLELELREAEGRPAKPLDIGAIDAAGHKARQRSHDVLKKSETAGAPLPALPNLGHLDYLLKAAPRKPIDVLDLAQQGKQLMHPHADSNEDRYQTRVLVFVSSSLPDQTILNYLRQTQRIGGAVVFRGLINNRMQDMRDYLARQLTALSEASDEPHTIEPSILIDPTLFRRFNIDQAPVTVVTRSDIKPCISDQKPHGCPTPVYDAVSGDVSLGWALGLISRQSDSKALKASLRPLIRELERI